MFTDTDRRLPPPSPAPTTMEGPITIEVNGTSRRLDPVKRGNTLSWRLEGELDLSLGGRIVPAEVRVEVVAVDPEAAPLPPPSRTPGL